MGLSVVLLEWIDLFFLWLQIELFQIYGFSNCSILLWMFVGCYWLLLCLSAQIKKVDPKGKFVSLISPTSFICLFYYVQIGLLKFQLVVLMIPIFSRWLDIVFLVFLF